jgi:predicted aminopeptidase
MRAIAFAFVAFAMCGCYYLSEGIRLAGVYGKAVPVDAALSDDSLQEDERDLLAFVANVKEYAVRELGLADNANYTTYIRTNRTYLADVVSACAPDSFDQYRFHFLFAGDLPYEGFFRREDALAEARSLEKKGLDVMVRKVEAFSTLGVLTDPIMEYMKSESKGRVAEVIIHEQVHATVFTTEYPDTSENLATFIGEQGSLQFMQATFGESSVEYAKLIALRKDSKTYAGLVRELYEGLDPIYKSGLDLESKLERKAETILEWKKRIASGYGGLFLTDAYSSIGSAAINNAYIATFRNYTSDFDLYERLYRKTGKSIRDMVSIMKEIIESRAGNPESLLRDYLKDADLRAAAHAALSGGDE